MRSDKNCQTNWVFTIWEETLQSGVKTGMDQATIVHLLRIIQQVQHRDQIVWNEVEDIVVIMVLVFVVSHVEEAELQHFQIKTWAFA